MNIDQTLVVIPARGGSKGVPGKNIKPLAGKPLIYYTIEAAREVFPDERILVSTDSEKIKTCVENTGLRVPFLRPPELATDEAGTYEVLLHALEYCATKGVHFKYLILLQATSPFRNERHIKEAMQAFTQEKDVDMLVSVKETASNPYYVLYEEDNNGFLQKSKVSNITHRQVLPKVWEVNGAIYIYRTEVFKTTKPIHITKKKKYVMDEISSVDIDNEMDWLFAEFLLKKTF